MKFRHLPGFSRLFVDWLAEAPGALGFLPSPPNLQILRDRALALRDKELPREEMHRLIVSQAGLYDTGPSTLENIARLLLPDSVVVLSALPAVFAGGPLEILLRCLTIAKIAAQLEKENIQAVPICWLNAQFHAPASRFSIGMPGQEHRPHLLDMPTQPLANDGLIDDRVSNDVAILDSRIRDALGFGPQDSVLPSLGRAFSRGTPFYLASARFIASLVGEWGIIFFDAAVSEFRDMALRLLGRAGFSPADGALLTQRQEERLREADYWPPGNEARRKNESQLSVQPGRDLPYAGKSEFTNVWSRVFLETTLPVATHVVDQREIRDVALAAPFFASLNLQPPLIWPRASATVLEARERKIMEKYGIGFSDLLVGKPQMLKTLLQEDSARAAGDRLGSLACRVEDVMRAMRGDFPDGDSSLELIEDTRSRLLFQLEKLKQRYASATALRREAVERQLDRVFNSLLPGGCLQESAIGTLHFALRYSGDFSRLLSERLNILSFEHQLISVE